MRRVVWLGVLCGMLVCTEAARAETDPQTKEALRDAMRRGDTAELGGLLPAGVPPEDWLLLEATEMGWPVVAFLLERGANPNAVGSYSSALGNAAYGGRVENVELLLAKGADPNGKPDPNGRVPLVAAVERKHPEVVRRLIAAGADIRVKYMSMDFLLDVAAREGDHETLSLLHAAGGRLTSIAGVADNGDVATLRHLKEIGALPRGSFAFDLAKAIRSTQPGSLATMKFLLDNGTPANAVDPVTKETLLMIATREGNEQKLELLVARGADPEATAPSGRSVFDVQRELLFERFRKRSASPAEIVVVCLLSIALGAFIGARIQPAPDTKADRPVVSGVLAAVMGSFAVLVLEVFFLQLSTTALAYAVFGLPSLLLGATVVLSRTAYAGPTLGLLVATLVGPVPIYLALSAFNPSGR